MSQSAKSNLEAGLLGIFEAFAQNKQEEQVAAAQRAIAPERMAQALDAIEVHRPDRFHLFAGVPAQDAVAGLLVAKFSRNPKALFLYQHAAFVDGHLRKVFESVEGHACSADKVRTVMHALSCYLVDGTPIRFDYSAKYTFHLPAQVLKTQDDILAYFEGLYRLYYGVPGPYLAALPLVFRAPAPTTEQTQQ